MMMTMMTESLGFHILLLLFLCFKVEAVSAPREPPGDREVLQPGSWPEAGSHRCPLRLEITLASPLDEKDSWYLICMFEHAGRAVFNGRKYESSYSSFPWLRR